MLATNLAGDEHQDALCVVYEQVAKRRDFRAFINNKEYIREVFDSLEMSKAP